MKAKERLRVVIIGCGDIARTGHLPAILKSPELQLIGFCDIRPEALEAMRQTYRAYQGANAELPANALDYREVIDEADCCIVALHPEHSVEIVLELLDRRIPVLDEKPLAGSLEDGRRVLEAVERSGVVYQVGFVLRYCDLIQEAIAQARLLGTPRFYQVSIYDEQLNPADPAHYAKIQRIIEQSLLMTHEASHVIDWMGAFTPAPIESVAAHAIQTQPEFSGCNLWACTFGYKDQSTLQLTVGWLLREQPQSSLRVVGPLGYLDLNLLSGEGEVCYGMRTMPIRTPPLSQAWERQLQLFTKAVRSGEPQAATVYDGIRALQATIACERSYQTHSTVYVKDLSYQLPSELLCVSEGNP